MAGRVRVRSPRASTISPIPDPGFHERPGERHDFRRGMKPTTTSQSRALNSLPPSSRPSVLPSDDTRRWVGSPPAQRNPASDRCAHSVHGRVGPMARPVRCKRMPKHTAPHPRFDAQRPTQSTTTRSEYRFRGDRNGLLSHGRSRMTSVVGGCQPRWFVLIPVHDPWGSGTNDWG